MPALHWAACDIQERTSAYVKRLGAFGFFLLFLGGIALVNLRGMGERRAAAALPPSAIELAAPRWQVVSLSGADTGTTGPIALQFDTGGGIAIRGACNQFGGTYEYSDGELRIGRLAGTKKACAGEAMRADSSLMEVMGEPLLPRLAAGELRLYTADGALPVRLRQPLGRE